MYADIVATVLNNPDKFGELLIFSIETVAFVLISSCEHALVVFVHCIPEFYSMTD